MGDCWLNIYASGSEHKNLHRDAYEDREPTPEITVNISFGVTRDMQLRHRKTGKEFCVPQQNGDVFVFDASFNDAFVHGIPRQGGSNHRSIRDGPFCERLSIAVWAKRRVDSQVVVPVVRRAPLTGWTDS